MIRPLRRRHDALFVTLALVLPLLFIAALAARPAPGELRGDVPASLSGTTPETGPDAPTGPWLTVVFGELPERPALLLYWVPQPPPASGTTQALPGGARLLGTARDRSTARYPMPEPAVGGRGALVLYSLGHQSVVGEAVSLDATAPDIPVRVGGHDEGSASP